MPRESMPQPVGPGPDSKDWMPLSPVEEIPPIMATNEKIQIPFHEEMPQVPEENKAESREGLRRPTYEEITEKAKKALGGYIGTGRSVRDVYQRSHDFETRNLKDPTWRKIYFPGYTDHDIANYWAAKQSEFEKVYQIEDPKG